MIRTLYPLSLVYRAALSIDRRLTAPLALPLPVISVGNITWGGTGKTPVVIRLANDLIKRGLRPIVLSRGYFRKDTRKPYVIVSDGKKISAGPETCGDEPYAIAENAPGAIVITGKDRFNAGREAVKQFSPDVCVLDDGFQHWRVKRDLDIVCVNALQSFGNGLLLPAGILREPLNALSRAGLVIITHSDSLPSEKLTSLTDAVKEHSRAPIITAAYAITSICRITDNHRFILDEFKSRPVIALSALAANGAFRSTLERGGISVKDHAEYRDHHWYTPGDLRALLRKYGDGSIILTTQKDAVKLKGLLAALPENDSARFCAVGIDLEILEGETYWHASLKKALPYL